MTRRILIDAPTDGHWVMTRCDGFFDPMRDHSFVTHSGDRTLGGFVVHPYFGRSMTVHMAGEDKHWCSRELMWLIFDFAFNQNNCHKMVAGLRSDNKLALDLDMRAGWRLEAVIEDLFCPGVDMMVLTMVREDCRWLNYKPRQFRSNVEPPIGVIRYGG